MNITPQSRLTPVELIIRPDRQGYIVEDAAARDYYEMPELCVQALRRMREGWTVAAIEEELKARFPGEEVDVAGFAEQLLDMRLVAELDGMPLRGGKGPEAEQAAPPEKKSAGFRWIPQSFARLLFHPALRFVYALAIMANVALLAAKPDLFPRYQDVFLFDSMVLNSVCWLGVSFLLLLLHELGHIAAVRSFGLPARLTIGHRFLFVVFETEMEGIWRLAPKQRNTAFLAGMGVDQLLLLGCLLAQAAFPGEPGFLARLAAFAALDLVVKLAFQCCFYMKTDLYFVVENATGCYNLMERSRGWLLERLSGSGRTAGGAKRTEEPRAVRWYAAFYAAGFALNLALVAVYFAPQLVVSVKTVVPWLANPGETARFWDAVVFLAELVGFAALLVYAWNRNRTRGVRRGEHRRAADG